MHSGHVYFNQCKMCPYLSQALQDRHWAHLSQSLQDVHTGGRHLSHHSKMCIMGTFISIIDRCAHWSHLSQSLQGVHTGHIYLNHCKMCVPVTVSFTRLAKMHELLTFISFSSCKMCTLDHIYHNQLLQDAYNGQCYVNTCTMCAFTSISPSKI